MGCGAGTDSSPEESVVEEPASAQSLQEQVATFQSGQSCDGSDSDEDMDFEDQYRIGKNNRIVKIITVIFICLLIALSGFVLYLMLSGFIKASEMGSSVGPQQSEEDGGLQEA